jgi:NADH-quinone oxidoreductase subunit N
VVFKAAVGEGFFALAVSGILGTVIGAYYYLRIVKVMFFDDPLGEPFSKKVSALEGALIAIAAIAISPLGYLAMGPLGDLTDRAAGSLF